MSQCLVLRLPAERCEINGNAYLQLLVCAEVPVTGGSPAKAHQLWEWSTEVGWMGVRQRTLPWWDWCLKPTHKTTSLSEEGQAMTICQRTTLSHLAGLALPRARISQALITYSSTACAFSRLRLTNRQTKSLCVLAMAVGPHGVYPFSIPRAGGSAGEGLRGPVCRYTWISITQF